MSNDLFSWFNFFFKFMYNFFYTVKVPGLNIPFIYLFIIVSLIFMLFGIVKRLMFAPNTNQRNTNVKQKNSKSSNNGG